MYMCYTQAREDQTYVHVLHTGTRGPECRWTCIHDQETEVAGGKIRPAILSKDVSKNAILLSEFQTINIV